MNDYLYYVSRGTIHKVETGESETVCGKKISSAASLLELPPDPDEQDVSRCMICFPAVKKASFETKDIKIIEPESAKGVII